jgi:hypothetical protein
MCQPAIYRFEWELEVSLTRMKKLGINNIVLLFSRYTKDIPSYLGDKYGVEVHVYDDLDDWSYIPAVKPYLWSKYLQEDTARENDSYFYLDGDVIFREIPEVNPNKDIWYGSDCASYLSIEYIESQGKGIFEEICNIVGVNPNKIREGNPTSGAQWVISKPTYEYWNKVYKDSNHIYKYLKGRTDSNIQKWTAEMWAQLYNVYLFGKTTQTHSELEFTWPTESVDRYYETKMLHNAGVVNEKEGLFFKAKYNQDSPFKANLNFVDPNRASIKYVEAIKEVSGYR